MGDGDGGGGERKAKAEATVVGIGDAGAVARMARANLDLANVLARCCRPTAEIRSLVEAVAGRARDALGAEDAHQRATGGVREGEVTLTTPTGRGGGRGGATSRTNTSRSYLML